MKIPFLSRRPATGRAPRAARWGQTWLGGPARLALAPLAGAALALSFPTPGFWPLAPAALGALFALFVTAAPRRAFCEGLLGGGVFTALLCRWFASVLIDFTSLGRGVAVAACVLAGLIIGTLIGALAWFVARIAARRGRGVALAFAPPLWLALDALRETFPFPFPWGSLGAAWASSPVGPPVAAVVGVYGLSLALLYGAALCAALYLGRRRAALAGLGVWAGLMLGLALGGQAAQNRLGRGPELRVAAVQASLGEAGDPLGHWDAYEKLTREAAQRGAKFVVWPESAVPFRIDDDAAYRAKIEGLARELGVDVVVGSVTAAPAGGYHNSDALVSADGLLGGVQPKRRLVPFGEYLPLRPLFGRVPVIAWEMGEDFKPGDRTVVLAGRHAKVGALVCYEGAYPALAADLAERGAQILANTTNDSWFGASAGPPQHLRHVLLRAAETGRPMVRAANSGVSAIVDRRGRVVASLPIGARGTIVANVELGAGVPPGAAVGGGVETACAIVAAAAILAGFALGRAPRRAPVPDISNDVPAPAPARGEGPNNA
ncbi:MAG: apolipoprotein N-acyltransferase [Candidatus Polarisedimenticolia bacterium]|nr:apolipoprotein N-acyltransferase [bacterium]